MNPNVSTTTQILLNIQSWQLIAYMCIHCIQVQASTIFSVYTYTTCRDLRINESWLHIHSTYYRSYFSFTPLLWQYRHYMPHTQKECWPKVWLNILPVNYIILNRIVSPLVSTLYIACLAPRLLLTRWSPLLRKVSMLVTIAAIPEENRSEPAAPSSRASVFAAASTVGLPQRVYI